MVAKRSEDVLAVGQCHSTSGLGFTCLAYLLKPESNYAVNGCLGLFPIGLATPLLQVSLFNHLKRPGNLARKAQPRKWVSRCHAVTWLPAAEL